MIDTVYVEQLGFWPCDHFWGDLYTMKCEGQIHPKNHIWYTVDEVYVKQKVFFYLVAIGSHRVTHLMQLMMSGLSSSVYNIHCILRYLKSNQYWLVLLLGTNI